MPERLCQRVALSAQGQIRVEQRVLPEDGSSAVAVKQASPLLMLRSISNQTVARESGYRQSRAEQIVHRILAAARVRLQIIDHLINPVPVTSVMCCWNLGARD